MKAVRIAAIIPARMASGRFPGKPLLEIRGFPMVEHVRRRALLCKEFSEVVVATCDREIADKIKGYGGKVVMTSSTHVAASDRVAEAMSHIDCTHVVNVQGDEILVLPIDLSKMVQAIEDKPDDAAWNAIAKIDYPGELNDSSVVKCVVTRSSQIMFCSRDFSFLPFVGDSYEPVRKILGILGYSYSFLKKYTGMPRTPIEIGSAIDQSRIIEHDAVLHGVEFSKGSPGIKEPREAPLVEKYLSEDPRQKDVLEQILSIV